MPFYFKKSVSAGPFRFNFSRGGVGASVGVKGFRVGTGPRGHYVHAGRGGFYYRATIGKPGERRGQAVSEVSPSAIPVSTFESGVEMIEVESADVLAMRDESFADMLDEINEKRRQLSMAATLGWSIGILGLLIGLAAGGGWIVLGLLGPVGWSFGKWLDSYRRTSVLFYDLEPEVQQAYERVTRGFDLLAGCAGRWHVEAGGAVQDITTWKRNAGASHIVRKKPTVLEYRLPAAVTSNITPPALYVGRQVIYFMPDVALVDDGHAIGAVAYSRLSVVWQDSNFIEDGQVPGDAEVIGYTWKHPNKSGGPDRRFRDNRQIPICRYEAMHLRSGTGLNELVEFSRTGLASLFAEALQALPKNTGVPASEALPAVAKRA
ncbi:DUF4236 domain-containing protein [Sphingomonas sp.]|jgi:hypothetical protein|uniref:DUF4236 domain-containing protein n=1 Tax=Sphingomonas sp. TaxID=28214 RepID=UPI0026369BCC|nr:DUF4236 domain-containing protein [Sphingomonas sp.]MDF2495073.1 hypothetical protein [Sphingomonas sp.]